MLVTKSWRRLAADGVFPVLWLGLITGKNQKSSFDVLLIYLLTLALLLFSVNVVLKLTLGSGKR